MASSTKKVTRKATGKAGTSRTRGGTPRAGAKPAAKRPSAKKAQASDHQWSEQELAAIRASAPKKPPPINRIKPAAKKPGRPTDYSPELADRICALIAADDTSLRQICAKPGMPHRTTVNRWLAEHEEFAAKYAHAREQQGETMEDGMRAIEQKVLNRRLSPQAARVVLNNRQWRMSKLAPKKYGVGVGGTGAGEGETVGVLVVRDLTGRKD